MNIMDIINWRNIRGLKLKNSLKSKQERFYKAFDSDMSCRGFRYEIGKKYKVDDKIEICNNGFHSCKNPLDILKHYDLTTSRFAIVSIKGVIDTNGDKTVSETITVERELSLQKFITHCVDYNIKSPSSGYNNKLAASENHSKLAASENHSKLAASGNYSNLAASGYNSNLAASGYHSNLAASGDDSNLAASGYYSKLAASGYDSKLAASGDDSKLAASGYNLNFAASGDYSNLAASGDDSKLAASGDDSIVASVGNNSKAKVGDNGLIVLTYYSESEKRNRIAVGYVGEGIKKDTWYTLDSNGKFIEV